MAFFRSLWGWISPLGIAFVLTLFVGLFLFQPYKVDGHSMDPTLHDTEKIYVSKLAHTFSYVPGYGDIVIIDSRVLRRRSFSDDVRELPLLQWFSGDSTDQNHVFYVKRLIGKPGDTIEVKEGHVFRNGVQLTEPYLNETMITQGDHKWVVPADQVFVMGDNRNHSNDSREIGTVPLDHIMGIMIQ